jgi:hypothetical protein
MASTLHRFGTPHGLAILPDLPYDAPAGIGPATPSLPSMRGRFTMLCNTSRPHTIAQVRGAVEGCVVGRSEVRDW